jgi:hypothetical protein
MGHPLRAIREIVNDASKATSKGHPATVGAMISAVLGKTSSIHD